MRKKLFTLVCIIGIMFGVMVTGSNPVSASYEDAPHAETSLPTNR